MATHESLRLLGDTSFASLSAALPSLVAQLTPPGARALLCAPPGTGKTTSIPLALLASEWMRPSSKADGVRNTIVMLEPRRIAARAAARRMAQLLSEPVGQTVGYRVRFDTQVSSQTRIEVLTEGLLVRRLQQDPELRDVGLIIFDELHERHIHTDLALALSLDVADSLRPDLRILAMSATLAADAIRETLGAAQLLSIAGAAHPVTTHYLGSAVTIESAVRTALEETSADVLVFLPGARAIRRTAEQLSAIGGHSPALICPLLGGLDPKQQDLALVPDPKGRRKVVLATNIAETSLTIPGVEAVVDSGLAREPRFDPNAALTRLHTVRISQSSAEQRKGRAGRLGPGRCYRLWSEAEQAARARFSTPEILQADLAPVLLELAAWGTTDPASLGFIDPLPQGAQAQAHELLQSLRAFDENKQLTAHGRRMAQLPVHPRLAAMLLAATHDADRLLACRIASLIEEGGFWSGALAQRPNDIVVALQWLAGPRSGRGINRGAVARIERAEQALRRQLKLRAAKPVADPQRAASLLLLAFPDRVARARKSSPGRYLMANGREVSVPQTDALAQTQWLIVADAGGSERGTISYLAAETSEEEIRDELAAQVQTVDLVEWDSRAQCVTQQRQVMLGRLQLSATRLESADPARSVAAMLDGIRQLGIEALPWSSADQQWLARVKLLRRACGEPDRWPDLTMQGLSESLETWLAPFLDGVTRRSHLVRVKLAPALATLLDWQQRAELELQAPLSMRVPSGREVALDYQQDGPPVLAVPLQDMFGAVKTPCVAWARISIQIQLLSPARRSLQVTQDLPAFWANGYVQVRKEMRGRYPKHAWPEDPTSAAPGASLKQWRKD